MAKHTRKVHPQVRALVAWQEARSQMFATRAALANGATSVLVHELLAMAERLPDEIERAHLLPTRDEEIAGYWRALGTARSIENKVRTLADSGEIDLDCEPARTLMRAIRRTQEAIESLIRTTEGP